MNFWMQILYKFMRKKSLMVALMPKERIPYNWYKTWTTFFLHWLNLNLLHWKTWKLVHLITMSGMRGSFLCTQSDSHTESHRVRFLEQKFRQLCSDRYYGRTIVSFIRYYIKYHWNKKYFLIIIIYWHRIKSNKKNST